jgi:hypothetical protein
VATVAAQHEAAQHEDVTGPDALDLWITEVGEDYVAGLVEATRQGVVDERSKRSVTQTPFSRT